MTVSNSNMKVHIMTLSNNNTKVHIMTVGNNNNMKVHIMTVSNNKNMKVHIMTVSNNNYMNVHIRPTDRQQQQAGSGWNRRLSRLQVHYRVSHRLSQIFVDLRYENWKQDMGHPIKGCESVQLEKYDLEENHFFSYTFFYCTKVFLGLSY